MPKKQRHDRPATRPTPQDERERIHAAWLEFKALPADATEAEVDAIIVKHDLEYSLPD